MSLNNAYFQCRQHGNVYLLPDVTIQSALDYERLEPLIEGIAIPELDKPLVCPLCGGEFRTFFGN